jgi:hypothetical protein
MEKRAATEIGSMIILRPPLAATILNSAEEGIVAEWRADDRTA